MLDRRHHLRLRGAVARQLVRDHDTRRPRLPLQQLAKQTLGGPLVAPALDQDVEHDPILVDSPPEPVLRSPDHQAHFVQVPLVARAWQLAADLVGEGLAELARPLAHGFMAHVEAAGGQHLFDHAQAEREAEVEPHGVADDLAWKAVAGIRGLGCGCYARHRPVSAFPAKPRPKLTVPGKELESLYEAHLQALRMFEKLIWFIPDGLSPTCQIRITSAAGEPVLTVFLPALASEERFRRVAGAQASTHRGPR